MLYVDACLFKSKNDTGCSLNKKYSRPAVAFIALAIVYAAIAIATAAAAVAAASLLKCMYAVSR